MKAFERGTNQLMGAQVTRLPLQAKSAKFGSIGEQQIGEVYGILTNQQYVFVRWANGWQSVEMVHHLTIAGYQDV